MLKFKMSRKGTDAGTHWSVDIGDSGVEIWNCSGADLEKLCQEGIVETT